MVDRATIANMAPEYGATMGFFGVDEETTRYLLGTGRSEEHCKTFENYYKAQGLWGIPRKGQIDYTRRTRTRSRHRRARRRRPEASAGSHRAAELRQTFAALLEKPVTEGGYGKKTGEIRSESRCTSMVPLPPWHSDAFHRPNANHPEEGMSKNEAEMIPNRPTPDKPIFPTSPTARRHGIGHGSVLIAAITSCTNTTNPSVMLGAGLLAKKAVEKGLKVNPVVKTSLAPGSRVVTDYLDKTGLQPYLDKLGFQTVGYGCTTCIGNSGPLHPALEEAIAKNDLVAASVLSGNRNFEARVHQNIKANFLMSPPLVVAFALAGTVDIDLSTDPLGKGQGRARPSISRTSGRRWRKSDSAMQSALKPEVFRRLYTDFAEQNPKWNEIPRRARRSLRVGQREHLHPGAAVLQRLLAWSPATSAKSTARARSAFSAIRVTTDHIRPPVRSRRPRPAGKFLLENGVSRG